MFFPIVSDVLSSNYNAYFVLRGKSSDKRSIVPGKDVLRVKDARLLRSVLM